MVSIKKYQAFFRNQFSSTIAYRGPILVWMFSSVLSLVFLTAVWQSAKAGQTIGSYTRAELISYYVVSFFFNWLINWFPFYGVVEEIKSGEISGSSLLKPLSFYWRKFSEELGWHAFSVILGTIFTLGIVFFFSQPLVLDFSWQRLLLTFLALALTTFVVFSFSLCLGLVSFWFVDIWILDSLFWAGRAFLGGQALPLSFIPDAFQAVVKFLPFRYVFSFPLEVYFGRLSRSELLFGFFLSFFWVLVFIWLYKIMWNRGRQAYAAFGN